MKFATQTKSYHLSLNPKREVAKNPINYRTLKVATNFNHQLNCNELKIGTFHKPRFRNKFTAKTPKFKRTKIVKTRAISEEQTIPNWTNSLF